MDKLDLGNRDILGGNVEKIAALFPGVVTEAADEATGELRKVVDFDLLRQHLSDELVEGDRERFRLDWPGKKASILKANTPIHKTLRPAREDSEDFDTTENAFIEGDNFEVLKVLQESYLGKIKMIYIDPPYNTGKDFIYRDNFTQDREDYEEEIGVRDDESGGKLVKNTETNGRYHSDWLSMMQERLIVARDLLTDDGVVFISIDDNEQANLKTLCDEVFGENNLVSNMTWNSSNQIMKQSKAIRKDHEYILCYSRQDSVEFKKLENTMTFSNPDDDPKGPWFSSNAVAGGKYEFEINLPGGDSLKRKWNFTEEQFKTGEVGVYLKDNNVPRRKIYESEYDKNTAAQSSIITSDIGTTTTGINDTKRLFSNESLFDNPKPVNLIARFTKIATDNDSIVLDFFSGSGTTAHAVMQLNAEDGGNRRHIQVQLAEPTDETSEAYKAGYKSIPEISRERIRRAGKKIRETHAEQIAKRDTPLDTGFRAYKLSSSNFKDTAKHPDQIDQTSLLADTDSIKTDRTADDLMTEVILSLGLTLDLPIETRDIAGHTVYFVGGNSLVACFDDTVSLDIVDEIALEKPLRVVFKDSSFANDETRINIDIRLRQLSPDTTVQVV